MKKKEELKVSNNTDVGKLAGAIAGVVREGKTAEILAIGAGSVNQAVKAAATARGFLSPSGIETVVCPAFREHVMDNGQTRTIIVIAVEER